MASDIDVLIVGTPVAPELASAMNRLEKLLHLSRKERKSLSIFRQPVDFLCLNTLRHKNKMVCRNFGKNRMRHRSPRREPNMGEGRQLVPSAILFGKVIAYECTACGRSFLMSLLYGVVPSDLPPPLAVLGSFIRHVCEEETK